jgi:hypothetical protein
MFSQIVPRTDLTKRSVLVITLAFSIMMLATVPAQAREVVIYNQTSSTLGPAYELVADGDGTLYGIADEGGVGYGSVYSLTPPAKGQTAWTETVLYSFQGGTDGTYPLATLTPDGQGGFFGSTTEGGTGTCPLFYGLPGCGTVFDLTPPAQGQTAWTKTILYNFQGGTDGNQPVSRLLMDPATGVLYGVTYLGGSYAAGTVFALTPPGEGQTEWTETVLHTFTGGSDGGYPFAYLIEDANGVLYGTATSGGVYGYGAAFAVTPPAPGQANWTESVIHSFGGWGFYDAGSPDAGFVADSSGNLYSTAADGGKDLTNNGAVYELSPPSGGGTDWTETVLYSFTGGKDGAIPANDILIDSTGAIYSTTDAGGKGNGTAFSLEPPGAGQTAWTLKVLYAFTGASDSDEPDGGLTVGKVGKNVVLFGTTLQGGTNGDGTVYELTGTGFVP